MTWHRVRQPLPPERAVLVIHGGHGCAAQGPWAEFAVATNLRPMIAEACFLEDEDGDFRAKLCIDIAQIRFYVDRVASYVNSRITGRGRRRDWTVLAVNELTSLYRVVLMHVLSIDPCRLVVGLEFCDWPDLSKAEGELIRAEWAHALYADYRTGSNLLDFLDLCLNGEPAPSIRLRTPRYKALQECARSRYGRADEKALGRFQLSPHQAHGVALDGRIPFPGEEPKFDLFPYRWTDD